MVFQLFFFIFSPFTVIAKTNVPAADGATTDATTVTAAGGGEAPAEPQLSEDQMLANIEASRAELAAEGGDAGAADSAADGAADGEADGAAEGAADGPADGAAAAAAPFPEGHAYWSRLSTLRSILIGGLSVKLYLQFLYKNNQADLILLKQMKDSLPERNSTCHTACITAHSYMHCGTTVDLFLRKNLEWLGKASNWAQFNAVASLGVVHKGHVEESKVLLLPYLPQDASTSVRPYQEGGALFALGLIHANINDDGAVLNFFIFIIFIIFLLF